MAGHHQNETGAQKPTEQGMGRDPPGALRTQNELDPSAGRGRERTERRSEKERGEGIIMVTRNKPPAQGPWK